MKSKPEDLEARAALWEARAAELRYQAAQARQAQSTAAQNKTAQLREARWRQAEEAADAALRSHSYPLMWRRANELFNAQDEIGALSVATQVDDKDESRRLSALQMVLNAKRLELDARAKSYILREAKKQAERKAIDDGIPDSKIEWHVQNIASEIAAGRPKRQ